MSHNESMAILNKMGKNGQLDLEILSEIDSCFIGPVLEKSDQPVKNTVSKDPDPVAVTQTVEKWKCPDCGYVHEGKLPNDLICPRCEQSASIFEKF